MDSSHHHQALIRRDNALQVAAIPTPSPQEGDVLVALSFVGVCGTDLQILNGARPDSAEILGHEAAGIVVDSGGGTQVKKGQRVVFNPSAQLPRGRILGHNVSGLFQQYFLVNAQAASDGLIQLVAEDFPPLCGALVEPVAGIVYTHELISHVVPELRSAVIFGAGPIGLGTATWFRQHGVRSLLVHPSPGRLKSAHDLGLLPPHSAMLSCADAAERILAWNAGQPLDAAVICTSMAGASSALAHAVQVVKDGGCIEMVTNFPASSATPDGISAEALRSVRAANICGVPSGGNYVFAEVSGRRIAFTSHRGTSRTHLDLAMQVLQRETEAYTPLITHVLSLRDATEAVQTLARSRSAFIAGKDCIKAVIDLASPSYPSHH